MTGCIAWLGSGQRGDRHKGLRTRVRVHVILNDFDFREYQIESTEVLFPMKKLSIVKLSSALLAAALIMTAGSGVAEAHSKHKRSHRHHSDNSDNNDNGDNPVIIIVSPPGPQLPSGLPSNGQNGHDGNACTNSVGGEGPQRPVRRLPGGQVRGG